MESSEELFARALRRIPGGVNSPVRAFRSVGGTPFFTPVGPGRNPDDVRRPRADWTSFARGDRQSTATTIRGSGRQSGPHSGTARASGLPTRTRFRWPNDPELVPSVEKVRLCNSGTEATMSAVRLARGFTGRDKIIKFSGCYHGHPDSLLIKAGSGALTHGHPDSAGIPEAFARETVVIPFNDSSALDAAFAANPGRSPPSSWSRIPPTSGSSSRRRASWPTCVGRAPATARSSSSTRS